VASSLIFSYSFAVMNKLRTARLLMSATILVIIAFQFYWLRKLYIEEQGNFKKSTDLVFRETMYRLQAQRFTGDSMIFKRMPDMNLFMGDVASTIQQIRITKDSLQTPKVMIRVDDNKHLPDQRIVNPKATNTDTTIVLNASVNGKSIHVEKFLEHNKTLNDTIPIKRIDSLYAELLLKEGINAKFGIIRKDPRPEDSLPNKGQFSITLDDSPRGKHSFVTNRVPVGFISPTFYSAEFDTPTLYLLKKISLPLLLSFLLVALTSLSFIFIYRSLVAQKRLTAIKNEFIGNITHELKTPIATVSVAIEAMKNFNALQSPERTQEYLGIAGQELNRLSLLVDKVLRLSMFETQQVELKYEWFDVQQLVKEVINSMQLQFEKTSANVQLELQGDDFMMMADQMHITSVVYNLVDNALKYSKEKPQILIHLEATANDIILKVKDSGIGIAAAYKDKVFDKFFRVPNGDKHNVKGYGLGLSYVAHIIAQHRGVVSIESEEGKGTTFIIKLPKENAGS
jgi:two-component system phosphate regulon sensor histidine kinase PhoR